MTEHYADWDGTIRHRETCSECSQPRRRGFATCSDHATAFRREDSVFESDAPSEPDWEQIVEDHWEARFDEDAAQDRYDNSVYGP